MKTKKRLFLERHQYAPEQNALHIVTRGKPAAGCYSARAFTVRGAESIAAAYKKIFPRIAAPALIATVKKSYPAPFNWLDREYIGRVDSRAEALRFANNIRRELAPGIGGRVSVKIKLVG